MMPVQAAATEANSPATTGSTTVTVQQSPVSTGSNDNAARCVPFSQDLTKCDSSVPVHYLEDGDPDDVYKGFSFSTYNRPLSSAVFSNDWIESDRNVLYLYLGHAKLPEKIGAYFRLNKIGTWIDAYNNKHEIDAVLTVVDANSGAITNYKDPDSIAMTGATDSKQTYGIDSPLGYNPSKRVGIELKVAFYYAGTSTPVPNDFKGLTGFMDLDGADNNLIGGDRMEGIELVSGFDGAWVSKDNHLHEYGQNGFGGWTDRCDSQLSMDAHARQHFVTAAFSGPEFTVRFSDGRFRSTYATLFNVPVLKSALAYKVTGKAVDETGKTIKTWAIADNLHQTADYSGKPPVITGYDLVGLKNDSAPQDGKITDHDVTVTWVYKEITVSSIPMTGSRELAVAAGSIVIAITATTLMLTSGKKSKKC